MILKDDLSATVLESTIRSSIYTHRLEAAASGVLNAYISADRKEIAI